MKRNPAPHEIQHNVPYLSVKTNCKWAGIILKNVIVDQGICYTEKEISKLVASFENSRAASEHDFPQKVFESVLV